MKKFNKKSLAVAGLALALSATALTGCNSDELDAKIDENASKAEASVNDAASKAADDLAAAKSALDAAIKSGDETNAGKLNEAIAELNTAIKAAEEAAKQEAATGDTTLNAAIADAKKAAEDATEALAKKLDDQIAALKIMMEDKVSDLATIKNLNEQIAALKDLMDDKANDLATIEQLTMAVADLRAELQSYISIESWNAATTAAATKALELKQSYEKLDETGMNEKVTGKIDSVYVEQMVKIMRSLDEEQAQTALKYATDLFDGVREIIDLYAGYNEDDYWPEDWNQLEKLYNDALEGVLGLTQDGETTIQDIADDLKKEFDKILSKSELADAESIVAAIDALSEALDANGYTYANAVEYERVSAWIEQWYEKAGEAEDKIGKAKVEALDNKFAEKKAAFDTVADTYLAKISDYLDYTVVYSDAEYKKLTGVYTEVENWLATVEAQRGFTLDNYSRVENIHGVFAAFKSFKNGAYARVCALRTAASEGSAINAKITTLTDEIKNMTMILAKYDVDYGNIKNAVDAWNETYFAGFAGEAENGNTNYDLLNHVAYAELTEQYENEILLPIAGIKEICDKLEEIGDIENVSIRSWKQIEEVQGMYGEFQAKFDTKVGSLERVEGINHLRYVEEGYATGTDVFNYYADLIEKYNEHEKNVDEAYHLLTVTKAADVTIQKADAVTALVKWYNTYLTLDITTAEAWPEGESYELCDAHTIDKAVYEEACKAYSALEEIKALKAAKIGEIKAAAEAIDKAAKTTALRPDLTNAIALCQEFTRGSYGKAGGFTEQQCKPADNTEIKEWKDIINAADAQVQVLEKELKAIETRINAVAKADLSTAENRTAAATEIESIREANTALKAKNGDIGIGLSYEKKLRKADVAVDYSIAVEKIATISNSHVKNDLTTRANETKADAEKAIDAIKSADEAVDLSLEEAKFELVAYVVDVYTANVNGLSDAELQANYQGAEGLYAQMKDPAALGRFKDLFAEHINSK